MDKEKISLNDILRLVFPSEDIIWLTDRKNVETQIDWVCINVENGQAGDLLITPSENINNESPF